MKISSRTHKRRNNGKPWSSFDLQRFKKLYPHNYDYHLARLFGRTCSAIRHKSARLGLQKKWDDEFKPRQCREERRRWSDYEIKTLKKMYPEHTFEEISDVIDRSRDAVAAKVQVLRLKDPNIVTKAGGRNWTKKEIEEVHRVYIDHSPRRTAEILGYPFKAVKGLVRHYGLGKARLWTKREEVFLKKHYKKMTYKELGDKFGRTIEAIQGHCEILGLVKHHQRKWSEQETRILKKERKKGSSWRAIAKLLGRRDNSCKTRIKRLRLR